MVILLSPTKTMDTTLPHKDISVTLPCYAEQASELILLLSKLNASKMKKLMKISDALCDVNMGRINAWSTTHNTSNSRPAVFTYSGEAFNGLSPHLLEASALDYLQDHLVVLSGLYGVLKPFDLVQPYRLEMQARLKVGKSPSVTAFWKPKITAYLKDRVEKQKPCCIVNLASKEYTAAIDLAAIGSRVVEVQFKERHGDVIKFVSFNAKRARGQFAAYMAQKQCCEIEDLFAFNTDGYQLEEENKGGLLFVRTIF